MGLANGRLAAIAGLYQREWLAVMRGKLGLLGEASGDAALVEDLLAAMVGADWTLTFRRLAGAVAADGGVAGALRDWLPRWRARLEPGAAARILAANPAVIPRNHLVEAALAAATAGDMVPFEALLAAVRDPYGPEHGREAFVLPAPEGLVPYVTFCGT